MKSILKLSKKEFKVFVKELKREIDPQIDKKVQFMHKKLNTGIKEELTKNEVLEIIVLKDPILWAFVYLNWKPRNYQYTILKQMKKGKQVVLRLGRRLGKTETMCIIILWYAYTQHNRGENDVFDILVITPYESQVMLIFKRLKQLIYGSKFMADSVVRDIHLRFELDNNTNIQGMTAGSKSSSGAESTRGQRADLIILDEVDYMGDSDITNIVNIRNEEPERIKIIAASTPSGRRAIYYKWCVNATHKFKPKREDIENFKFTGYIEETNKKHGNGWTQIYSPSIVNKHLLKINPETDRTYLEDLKDELTEIRFLQEVMAEFGEEIQGVYRNVDVDWIKEESKRIGYSYLDELPISEQIEILDSNRFSPMILGIDWDKYNADTNMVCVALDRFHRNEEGQIEPKFKVLFRKEISRGEFTYTNAVSKVIELNNFYDFDWIAIDRGYGETQIEMLKKAGMKDPISRLHKKLIGYQFSQKLEVRDPHTKEKVKKHLKPFMINNSVKVLERHKLIFPHKDHLLLSQFEDYHIVSKSASGRPKFSDENEHILDGINLCLLAIEQKYGELFKHVTSVNVIPINEIYRKTNKSADNRNIMMEDSEGEAEVKHIAKHKSGIVAITSINSNNKRNKRSVGSSGRKRAMF